ncbi:MAG TPA: hypothetical protein DEF34_06305 [Desulfotomaculum sp.]|nr:MAG: membrane protein [Peptococcaceae bacterium BRH_c8a]KJS72696.1 MAG: membrane protein [Desulfotomaculum sp. BICA1-6]HBX23224.1 hypothetical protein [Desulfotomaculum sp.]
METKSRKVSSFQIGATYIGVTIGAGFASGQEVLQFFAFFGQDSFPALLLTTVMFVFFGWLVLRLGALLKATSHREVIMHASGKSLGVVVDIVITFFLFGSFTVMLAGAGASVEQQFGISPLAGTLGMAVISLVTVLFGLTGIVSAMSVLVPVMVIGVLGVFVGVQIVSPLTLQEVLAFNLPNAAVMPSWPLSAATYVSYNMLVAVAVLSPLGASAGMGRRLKDGALLGGVGLGLGILVINLVLMSIPQSAGFPIPMIYIANQIFPLAGVLYTMVLVMAIYTTAVGGLYGFSARVADVLGKNNFRSGVLVTVLLAVIASQVGFTILVRFLYTGLGIGGFLMLGGLLYNFFRGGLRRPRPDPVH